MDPSPTHQAPHTTQWPHTAVMKSMSWWVTQHGSVVLMDGGLGQSLNVQVTCILR